MAFRLTQEQQAAVTNRGGGLLVSAAAGSGKTRVMVERLLERVEGGTDIDRFLVITYTKAAAAELRGRIVSELSDRLSHRPGDAFLRRQTTLVYQAQISTIDAFCAQFLREEGHRLELDHDFRLCDENEADLLLWDALSAVLDRRYETIAPGSDFALLVDTMSAGRDDSRLVQMVLDVRSRIQSHPDPVGWLEEQEKVFALEGATDAGASPWGELLLAGARRQADYWAGRMMEALELCQGDEVLTRAYAPSLQGTLNGLLALSAATAQGWDATVVRAAVDFPKLNPARNCEDPAVKERITLLRNQCKKRMEKLAGLFFGTSEELLADMRGIYPAIRGLFSLVRELEEEYTAVKRRRGVLDFSDLEHMTKGLLVGEDGRPTELAYRWGERFDEVMVDEYQDTNAVQNAIFDALTDGGKNLFMVGDVKQSIYRFRLADPTIFMEKYRTYRLWDTAGEGEPRKALLTRNFRSRPQVLEGCNYLFRSIMSIPFGEMDYTDAEALRPGGSFVGREEDYALELDLLDCSSADEEEGGDKPPKDQLEARFAAGRVRELLDQGFQVSDGEGGLRPLRSEDVVILHRSPGTVLHYYAQALGELGIPWEAQGGGDFFAASEVRVALSFLQIIDNPHQDVPLIAVLRSAVFAFSADRLAQIRSAAPGEDFYTALTREGGADTLAFLEQLGEFRSRAGDESCDRLLWRLYDQTNLLGIYANLDEGELRRGNLLLLAQLARDFEAAGHKGLFGFLAHLRRLEERGAPVGLSGGGEGLGGVRIMSVHRSKGLEFPVVILSGLSRQPNRTDTTRPMLFHPKLGVGPKGLDLERMVEYPTLARQAVAQKMLEEQAAEELRLLYVAMTRAQDKLIMTCALTRGSREVEDLLPSAGSPVEPQALMDCKSPAQWILLAALARPEAALVRPGDGLPPAVRGDVPLGPAWDIKWHDVAPLKAAPVSPARREEKGPDPAEDEGELSARFTWTYSHAEDVDLPSKLTATQLKGRNLDEEVGTDTPPEPQQARAPRFARPRFAAGYMGLTPAQKGTALHLVMQYIDFSRCGDAQSIAAEIQRLVEQKFITDQQAQAVDPDRIGRFFASDLGRELTGAPTLQREFKFSLLVPARRYYPQAGEGEEILLQGVVDCYFETETGITVVDFKTDQVEGEALTVRAEEYRPQLTAYAEALAQITGRPVTRRLLWFFSEGRAVEV